MHRKDCWPAGQSRGAFSQGRRLRFELLEQRRVLNGEAAVVAVDQSVATREDASLVVMLAAADTAPGATFAISQGPVHGSLSDFDPATGRVTYTPAGDYNGPDIFTFTVSAGSGDGPLATSAPGVVSVTVQAINDRPTLDASDPPAVDEDTGTHHVPFWADYEPGAANELRQRGPTYQVNNVSRPQAFSVLPSVSTLGRLTYTLAPNAFGTVTFDVAVKDSGGTADGANDTSIPQTFTITISPINDPPRAERDYVLVDEDSRENRLNVLANDTFAPDENEILSVVAVGKPWFGTTRIVDGGTAIAYTPAPNYVGEDSFTYEISDGNGLTHSSLVTVNVQNRRDELLVTAPGPGVIPRVRVFDAATRIERFSFLAYHEKFRSGVRVAVGDVNGDGVADVITGAGPGGGPHVRVFDGRNGEPLAGPLSSFLAYDAAFTGGVFVAAGDVNGDGLDEVITGADAGGGPHVRVFNAADGSQLLGWMAYATQFSGGVRVAAADVNADGMADIITGAGTGGGPHVRVLSGSDGTLLADFFAYAANFAGGVYVAAGDVNGGGLADIVTGAGAGGGPHVKAFGVQPSGLMTRVSFFADEAEFRGGVTVAVTDLDGLRDAEIVVGQASGGSMVRTFDLAGNTQPLQLAAYPGFSGGAFVAGSAFGAYYPSGWGGGIGLNEIPLIGPRDLVGVVTGGLPVIPVDPLTEDELDLIRAAVFEQWQQAGLPARIASLIHQVVIRQEHLTAGAVARVRNEEIVLDLAGDDWFVDLTPQTNEEFAAATDGARAALAGSDAEGRIDLLTALNLAFASLLEVEAHGSWANPSALPQVSLAASVRRGVSPELVDAILGAMD